MNEDFLAYIWQFKLWDKSVPLKTICGKNIEVISVGQRNLDAGPDFSNAHIKIGDIEWVGNIEIHFRESDWFLHKHQTDKNYDNIILHIVGQNNIDREIGNFHTLELMPYIQPKLKNAYHSLLNSTQFIPCEKHFKDIDDFALEHFLESLFISRLSSKHESLKDKLDYKKGDWEALLFEKIAYAFGLKINAQAFELLAKSISFGVLQKAIRNKENLEALIFGQSGFLNEPQDDYQQQMKVEYDYMKQKYRLEPLNNNIFKFLRLRPVNFPTIRLAQLSNLYSEKSKLFSQIINAKSRKEIINIFESIKASSYWDNHYSFGKKSKRTHAKVLTKSFIDILIINVILPIKWLYNQHKGKEDVENVLEIAYKIPPEKNSILENFKKIGAKINHAQHSQAYLELKNNFCNHKKCLNCRVGNYIIKNA